MLVTRTTGNSSLGSQWIPRDNHSARKRHSGRVASTNNLVQTEASPGALSPMFCRIIYTIHRRNHRNSVKHVSNEPPSTPYNASDCRCYMSLTHV
eukprot:m.992050 g.992050  ORF g.992050 m.992050 type:complete len:95 (+) comp24004_c0_seq3:2065-2349(+)